MYCGRFHRVIGALIIIYLKGGPNCDTELNKTYQSLFWENRFMTGINFPCMERKMKVEIFQTFEEENKAESIRRSKMTPRERLCELAVLQERQWGEKSKWKPIEKTATWEMLKW